MANITLLISETYLKQGTVLNENADIKVIEPNIKLAQDLYIHTTLGTDLYNEILGEVSSGSLSPANNTLLTDWIKPALKYYVLYELGRDILYKWMNKGIVTKSSDNSQPVDPETINKIREEYRDKAEWYRENMIGFLCENESDYPAYSTNSTSDKLYPRKSGFTSPIYLKPRSGFYCKGAPPDEQCN
jgi:hypothetical protein